MFLGTEEDMKLGQFARLDPAEHPVLEKYVLVRVRDMAGIDREVVVAYGADTGAGFLRQPYIDPTGPNPTDLLFWDDFDTSVIAAFGEVSFDLGDRSELSLAPTYGAQSSALSSVG